MSPLQRCLVLAALACMPAATVAQRRAVWSPDGSQLAFTFGDRDSLGVWLVRTDGSDLHLLAVTGKQQMYPSWSPDGKQIAFSSDSGGFLNIYVIDVDGQKLRQLTSGARSVYPSWSPDGRTIAFTSNRTGNWQLFVMRPDGSDIRQITHSASNEWNPEWSPDGRSLVFESARNGHDQDDVYTIDVLSGEEHQLTRSLDNEIFPSWSRDGRRIVYCVVVPRVRADLWLIDADGKSPASLLINDGCLPQWSPRGNQIAFARGGQSPGIYILDVATGAVRKVVR